MADLNETLIGVEDEDNESKKEEEVKQEKEVNIQAKKDKHFLCKK